MSSVIGLSYSYISVNFLRPIDDERMDLEDFHLGLQAWAGLHTSLSLFFESFIRQA